MRSFPPPTPFWGRRHGRMLPGRNQPESTEGDRDTALQNIPQSNHRDARAFLASRPSFHQGSAPRSRICCPSSAYWAASANPSAVPAAASDPALYGLPAPTLPPALPSHWFAQTQLQPPTPRPPASRQPCAALRSMNWRQTSNKCATPNAVTGREAGFCSEVLSPPPHHHPPTHE